MSFETPAKPELELHEWSLSDEYSEPSSITSNEFYCLDGGFASHLPTHYKVRMNRTLCKPTRIELYLSISYPLIDSSFI